jgi:hypothetical protein
VEALPEAVQGQLVRQLLAEAVEGVDLRKVAEVSLEFPRQGADKCQSEPFAAPRP